jgi:hypothetical protein
MRQVRMKDGLWCGPLRSSKICWLSSRDRTYYHAAALATWAIYTLIARTFLIEYYTSWLVCLYNARGQFCHHSYVYVYIYIAACEGRKILMVLSPAHYAVLVQHPCPYVLLWLVHRSVALAV